MSSFCNSRIIFCLLLTLLSFIGNAQVYFSHFEGELFVGPANVLPTNNAICDFMIEELKNAQDHMKELRLELANLQEMSKLKRSDKRRKVNLESSMLSRGDDVKALKILVSAWIKHKELLGRIDDADCYRLEREGVEITHTNSRVNPFSVDVSKPYIDLVIAPLDEPVWVKKKTNDCQSADPEDCLIWCMVSESRKVYDVLGDEIEEHQLQILNLDYDKKWKRYCGKDILLARNGGYELIINDTNKHISLEGIELVECEK